MMRVPPTRFAHLFMCSTCRVLCCSFTRLCSCSLSDWFSMFSLSSTSRYRARSSPLCSGSVMPLVSRLKRLNCSCSMSRFVSASFTELFSCSCSSSLLRNLCTMSMTSVRPVTSRIFWNPSSVVCDRSTCSNVIFCRQFPASFSIAYSFRRRPADALNASLAASWALLRRHSSNASRWFLTLLLDSRTAFMFLMASLRIRSSYSMTCSTFSSSCATCALLHTTRSCSATLRDVSACFLPRWLSITSSFSFRRDCSFDILPAM
mmetsp:Transcript_53134/g.138457  ORF Transcript_53134/g.138457 Transcript_53134/m.138457 type:complete len:262 (-) Transcript_53134:499-1284(-)